MHGRDHGMGSVRQAGCQSCFPVRGPLHSCTIVSLIAEVILAAEHESTKKPNSSSEKKGEHGLRVPLPAVLVGLGMMASSSQQAEAATAVDDNYSTTMNATLTGVNILANDTFGNSFVVVEGLASHGSAVVDNVGNLTYTPDPGFVGLDSFTYVLADTESNSIAQVNIQVVAPTPVPTLSSAALAGLSGLVAFFGFRGRRRD